MEHDQLGSRRSFLLNTGMGLGATALATLIPQPAAAANFRLKGKPKAKRVIFLFMAGAPSQLDLFDHKPGLEKLHGQPLPPPSWPVKETRGPMGMETARCP